MKGIHLNAGVRSSALVLSSLLLLLTGCSNPAKDGSHTIRVQNQNLTPPKLVFACDRPTKDLQRLFTPGLISDLRTLGAGVALSTEDLSPERAEIVRRLNASGIPMTAWLVLPKNQGYYVNASNEPETATRFVEFDQWTKQNHLRWDAIGLDIEPILTDFGALTGHKMRLASLLFRRASASGSVTRAKHAYTGLIGQMQSRGYYVETYQLQFIADERKAHTTLLEKIFGIVDVRGNDEVLMLYTTFSHGSGAGLIWAYGPDAQTIAVGSTASSGNSATDAKYPPLNWEEFSRDLIVARHFSPVVGVYSLEGCVRQGFITRLKAMDWNRPVLLPRADVEKAARFRRIVHRVLWVAAHLVYIALALFFVIAGLAILLLRRWKRKRSAKFGTSPVRVAL